MSTAKASISSAAPPTSSAGHGWDEAVPSVPLASSVRPARFSSSHLISSEAPRVVADAVVGAAVEGFSDVFADASRAIIFNEDGTLLMITTPQYGEYGFPGGRKDLEESDIETLAREVLEETGYAVDIQTVEQAGAVEVIRQHECFGNTNLRLMNRYFFCAARKLCAQHLDAFEASHGVEVVHVTLEEAIRRNERVLSEGYRFWVDRDLQVLRWLASGDWRR